MKLLPQHWSIQNSLKLFIAIVLLIIGILLIIASRSIPAAPTHLHAAKITNTTVSLAWNTSTVHSSIKNYDVYQNNKVIGNTSSNQFIVKNLKPRTSYRFYVKARDARGKISAASNTIIVTTAAEKQLAVSQIQVSPIAKDGKTISGTVTLSVSVNDNKRVSKVEFYSDNGRYLIKRVTSAPYQVTWATNTWVPNGPQMVKAVIYTTSNQKAQISRTVIVNNAPAQYQRIGYYTGYSTYSHFQVSNIDAGILTQLNYAFAAISSAEKIELGDPWADVTQPFPGDQAGQLYEGNFYQLTKLKRQYPNLKTLISIGGWDGSARFSDVALTDQSRTIFADSCLQFILKYGFDGVDLDWEYPVSGGKKGNSSRPEDKQDYTLLLQKIRETFNAQSTKDGKKYLLTITGGVGKSFTENTELKLIQQYVDAIQLMAYDIHGSWDNMTGMNAPLYLDPNSGFQSEWSIQDAVQAYLHHGVPANKLILGIPLYGREYNQVNNQNDGLYQKFSGGGSAVSYGNLVTNDLNKNGYTRYWDSASKVPYLFNGSQFISYDDAESIGDKTSFIKSIGLGGAMMWELSQDPDKLLLSKIYDDLK